MAIEFPANPSDQDSFVANNVTYIYDGTLGVWNIYSGTTYNGGFGGSGGANVTVSDSAPSSPSAGDLWWESDVGRLKIYYDDGDTQQWVDASPSSNTVGGSNSVIAPTAIGIINNTSGTGTGLSWGNWDAGNGTLDITFDNAQPDANYAVVTDGESQDDGRLVSVQNKTTTGFEISLYDVNGNVTSPSAINIFTVMVFASTPTQLVQTNPYSDNAVDSHLNVSTATTGEVLSWTGTDYDWITGGGGGASVTTSDTAPSNPSEGDLWYDTTELTTYVYYNDGNSSQWVNASPNGMSASLNISDTAPSNPSDGDLWFDSTTLKTFVYYNDGSSSQWVTLVPTTGGTGGGVTTYADTATMVAETPDAGSLGFVTANNNLYLYNGSGWGKVDVTNVAPVIDSVQDASANTSSYSLAIDGTPTVITVSATDPEGFPMTYSYSVSTGSLSNGGGDTATVTQGTGAQANEFTVTPSTTEAYAGTFGLTFTVDDGYASVDSGEQTFTLAWISWYGDRALSFGFQTPADIQYMDITTLGDASNFGDYTGVYSYGAGAGGNSQYAVVAGNKDDGSMTADMQYVTVSTTGNAQNWGDLVVRTRIPHGTQHVNRVVWFPGEDPSLTLSYNNSRIQYMTLASQGNASDFGNITVPRAAGSAASDGTRGYYAQGFSNPGSPTRHNVIDVVTIDTAADSTDFGDAGRASNSGGAMGTDFRWVTFGGTSNGSSNGGTSTIYYYPVGATGTSAVFGSQLSSSGYGQRGVTNNSRGLIVNQQDPLTDTIQYIEIATLGNAVDFGNSIAAGGNNCSTSGAGA